jgi:hypothetical protein
MRSDYRLTYLDRYVKNALPGIHNDEWQPLMSYRASLIQHNEFDLPVNRAPGRQYRAKKRGRDEDGLYLIIIFIEFCVSVYAIRLPYFKRLLLLNLFLN